MSSGPKVSLPNIGINIIQGAYGRRGKQVIEHQKDELVQKATQIELDPQRKKATRLRWDNLKRKKYGERVINLTFSLILGL